MIEAKIVLGAQEALLDCPVHPSSRSEFRQCGSDASISEIIGDSLRITQAAPRPQPTEKSSCGLISEWDPGSVVEPHPLAICLRSSIPISGSNREYSTG